MDKISITAIFTPVKGAEEQLVQELRKAQQSSRQEEGCLQYDLHKSIEDETIVLHEQYENMDALNHHIESDHYKTYRENTADLVATRDVYKVKEI